MVEYNGICKAEVFLAENIPFHVSPQLKVIHVLENSLKFTTVAGSKVLKKGDTEIINLKEPVMLEAVSVPAEILCLSFDNDFISSWPVNFEWVTYNCLSNIFFDAQASKENIDTLTRMMLHLVKDMNSGKHNDHIGEKCAGLLDYIIENFDDIAHVFQQKDAYDMSDISRERFQRISEYMISQVSERISLKDIATREHLSLQYLSKEFSMKLEKTFNSMMNYYRVINAVIQLLDTDDSLTNIAERTGFSALRYYHRAFGTFLHCTPGQFRKKYKGKTPKVISAEITDGIFEKISRNPLHPKGQTITIDLSAGLSELVVANSNNEDFEYTIKTIVRPGERVKILIEKE